MIWRCRGYGAADGDGWTGGRGGVRRNGATGSRAGCCDWIFCCTFLDNGLLVYTYVIFRYRGLDMIRRGKYVR